MSLDLDFDAAQRAAAQAVGAFCARHAAAARRGTPGDVRQGGFDAELWKGLAELGVLSLALPRRDGGDGGALELVAVLEEIGAQALGAPLVDAVVACRLLPEPERSQLASGARIASLGSATLAPWADVASVWLEVDGDRVWRAPFGDPPELVASLGGGLFGRGVRRRVERLPDAGSALGLGRLALAALLVGGGRAVLDVAAAHAAVRRQFGRPIGEFQAVAHPLADVHVRLVAAAHLCHAAASGLAAADGAGPSSTAAACDGAGPSPTAAACDGAGPSPTAAACDGAGPSSTAAAAWLSARGAALQAVHTAHQVLGAQGMTLEGPLFHHTRQIRQLASHPMGVAAARRAVLAGARAAPCEARA